MSMRKIIRASRSKTFQPFVLSMSDITPLQSRVTVMSTSSEKLSSSSENGDAEERNLETKTNEEEIQKDEKKTLQCTLTGELYPVDLRIWPIFSLLRPDFIPQIHTVMVYGNGGNGAIIVTKDKNVYNLGFNEDNSKTSDIQTTFCLKKIEELCRKSIKTFAYSLYFILALTEEGEVYSWEFRKRNLDVKGPLVSTPTRVVGLSEKRIVDIACGSNHSLALTSDGKVYAWGENNYGQVGNENTGIFNGSLPRQVKHELEKKTVIHIACGLTFNMVMTDENKLYGWGNNEYGQILIDNNSVSCTATIGSGSTVDYTSNSTSFTFGSTNHKSNSTNSLFGRTFSHSSNFTSPAPSFGFPVDRSSKSQVLDKITPDKVQSQKYYMYPREIITISDKIVKVACGYEHTLALTDKGEVCSWGKNNNGQVGLNIEIKPSGPIVVNVPQMGKVLDIAAYGNLSVAVGCDRTIYVWGDCFDECITTPFPTKFSRIHDVFAYTKWKNMHKPLIVSTNVYNYAEEVFKILESLETEFDNPLTSDVTIQVEGQSIHVHKAILKIRCQYFKDKFQHDWTENNQNVLDSSPVYTVSDKFSYIVYKAFLKYLYAGTIDLPSEKALELMKLADTYRETSLKKNCSQIIEKAITVSNVAFFYNKAIECKAKELEEICFQFALCHMKDVVLSDDYFNLDMDTKDNFMRRAAEENAFRT